MRYWAAGFLLTVLLFGGALLGAGKDTGTSRPVPDADPGQTGTVPGQSAADGAVLLRVWDGEQVVEMTMAELEKIFQGLGAESFGAPGDAFDPNLHNAVMHTADESLGESTIVQVFQKGFRVGEKVIRFAMVQVAN